MITKPRSPNLKRALLALEITGTSGGALQSIASFCTRLGTQVELVHVQLPADWVGGQRQRAFQAEATRAWNKTAEHVTEQLRQQGVEVTAAHLNFGEAKSVLLDCAAAYDVVILTRPHQSEPLGEVTKRLLRLSHVPVLVVPERGSLLWRVPVAPSVGLRVVVPTDLSENASQAVQAGFALAAKTGGELELVNVSAGSSVARIMASDPFERNRLDNYVADVDARLAGLQNEFQTTGVPVVRSILFGRPADAIAQLAAERGADLIIATAVGKGAVRRALLGSTTERLAQVTRIPVLVLRQEDDRS